MFAIALALFGGPAGVVTKWFTSGFGKAIAILALVAVISGLGTSIYFSFTGAIRAAEDAKFKIAQQQDLIANKDAEIVTLKETAALQESVRSDQMKDNAEANLQAESIQAWLAGRDSSKDPLSSQVLRDTFSKLRGTVKR